MKNPSDRASSADAGFTLIELMVVIGILSLLFVALQPAISSALGKSEDTETQTRMLQLDVAAKAFEDEYGYYPPANFQPLGDELDVKAKADGINSGIESFMIMVSWSANGGTDFSENEKWLANTDGDENGTTIPLLERKDKVEVVDAWGTPFAYFVRPKSSTKAQTIRLPSGEDIDAKPWKNPNSSGYLGGRRYQFVSAGSDQVFNTEDDLTWPERPIE